ILDLTGHLELAPRHMLGNVEKAEQRAEIVGGEAEGAVARGLAEAHTHLAAAEQGGVDAHRLPMEPVTVELPRDIARLTLWPEDKPVDGGVDNERRITLFRLGRTVDAGHECRRIEAQPLELDTPAAFGAAGDRAARVGLTEHQPRHLDAEDTAALEGRGEPHIEAIAR